MSDTKSRYSIYGFTNLSHKGNLISTSVGTPKWDSFIANIDNNFEYKVGYIPVGYEHRPDMISWLFYDTPGYWWLLMQVNNVADPFDGFNVGDQIKIPIIK